MADTTLTGPGSDGRKTPLPDTKAVKTQTEYKVMDVRANDVTLGLDDGRVFVAEIDDSVNKEDLKRNAMVSISHDGLDKSESPKAARVTRILPKKD